MTIAALQKAITVLGSQSALAREVGVKQGNVWNWLNITKKVPAEYVLKIETATGGAISRHELRPDIYPEIEPDIAGAGDA